MAKPILFETISRLKYEALDAAKKLKNNYLIKEDNGTTTKHIGGLETEGGSNDFVVIYTENDDAFTADKTFAEITAAYEAGKNIKAKADSTLFTPSTIDDQLVVFINTSYQDGKINYLEVTHYSDDALEFTLKTITPDSE